MDQVEYDAEYEKARKELDDAAGQPTTAKVEVVVAPEKVAVIAETIPEVIPEADPLEGIRHELEQTKKALKDTQSWGTRNAQELAQFKRESDDRKRQAERPAILDANPELEAAIKYVRPEVVQEQPQEELLKQHVSQRDQMIERAHPGIFGVDLDPELIKGITARYDALGDDILDPVACIREINAEKLAHSERVIGRRFAAENAKAAQKNAMTVPGAGGSGASKTATPNTDADAVNRIANMSPAEFEKERRRVIGY